jgi:hypothetical protein
LLIDSEQFAADSGSDWRASGLCVLLRSVPTKTQLNTVEKRRRSSGIGWYAFLAVLAGCCLFF